MARGTTTQDERTQEEAAGALRLGVVGAGHFGRYHAQKYATLDGARLIAVVDIDEAGRPSPPRSGAILCPTHAR